MILLFTAFSLLVCSLQVKADVTDDVYEQMLVDADVDSILNNDRILDTYLKCFFNTGPCSELAELIKDRIPEAFSTVCSKCSERRKQIFRHVLHVFIPKRPDDWKHILEIYDPEGKYWPGIKAFLDEDPDARK